MPRKAHTQTKRRRGFKACDPFCTDKVRVALYNRPNGPFMGRLVLGKTYLPGLDDKCFSRSGRIKKGYRNVPIDLEREFEIEKRQLQQIHDMINRKPKKRKGAKKIESKHPPLSDRQQTSETDGNANALTDFLECADVPPDSLNHHKDANVDEEEEEEEEEKAEATVPTLQSITAKLRAQPIMIKGRPIQSMDKLKRFNDESFQEFTDRVKATSDYFLNEPKYKKVAKIERKHKAMDQIRIETKRLARMEHKRARLEQLQFEESIRPKKEYIPFGATNNRPPENLHELGNRLFGKKRKGEKKSNIASLSFSQILEERAIEIRREGVLGRYAGIKKRRYEALKAQMKKPKRKVW